MKGIAKVIWNRIIEAGIHIVLHDQYSIETAVDCLTRSNGLTPRQSERLTKELSRKLPDFV